VTVEIEQPGAGRAFSGVIRADCFGARFEAQLIENITWEISGSAHFSLITDDYCSYRATLGGQL
jgi:hypothetical protein